LVTVLFPAIALFGIGCGMVTTGEPWSTKELSTPVGAANAASLHVEFAAETRNPDARSSQEQLRDSALQILRQAADAEYSLLRANAIEAMQFAPEHLDPLVRRGLVDDNRGVRFVAAMTIGEYRMDHLAHLLEPLLHDESESVHAAAIYGLKRCDKAADLTPLSSMIVSDDPEVRANAAVVLGDLGNSTAVPVIQQALGRGMDRVNSAKVKMVDLQLAEALVKLGEVRQIEAIRAALFAPPEEAELTALACMMCARLHDERTVPNLIRLARLTGQFQQPAEVRMAATWALAHVDPTGTTTKVPMEYVTSTQYQLRMQAALTLGEIGDPASFGVLTTLLADENPMVQVAAASAVLQLLNPEANRRNRL